jgi:NADPH2:quinone reductase
MRAVVFERFGPPAEVLQLRADVPPPARKPGECLIRVAATSVNAIDWKTRKGEVPRFAVKFPNVLGGDVAGVVAEADGGSAFPAGTRVFACTSGFEFWRREGAYAELVAAPEAQLSRAPARLTLARVSSAASSAGQPKQKLFWKASKQATNQPTNEPAFDCRPLPK